MWFFSILTLISERQSLDLIIFGPNSYGDVLIIDPLLSVQLPAEKQTKTREFFGKWKSR